jgi:CubicO group peptidase (beta-lactamase class C family)
MNQQRLERALQYIQRAIDTGWIAGGSLLVARRGVIVTEAAYGVADVEKRVPFTTTTIASIASITKPMTAVAALALADEGRLELEDPVEMYLPAFSKQLVKLADGTRVHRAFTIRQLLTHTSGLQVDSPVLRALPFAQWYALTLAATVDAVAQVDLEFEPGTRSQYSNIGLATVGRIIEVVSGQSFEAFMKERLFAPLGMRDSYFNVPAEVGSRTAPLYFFEERQGRYVRTGRHEMAGVTIVNTMAHGGAFSTLQDLATFAQMILNRGEYAGHRILAPSTVDMMLSDQTKGLPSLWGLSWILGTGRRQGGSAPFSERAFSHTGRGVSLLWGDPDERLIGVLFLQPMPDFGPLGARSDLTIGPLETVWRRFRHLVYAALDR